MDMSSAYKKFVRDFFPNALIVADKLHVLGSPTNCSIWLESQGLISYLNSHAWLRVFAPQEFH